jgi:DNA-binding NarL/FixJ family response regulator
MTREDVHRPRAASTTMVATSHAPSAGRGDAGAMTLRCFVVDDSTRFVAAVRVLLERQGMTVVGVASNAAEALEGIVRVRPDVTLVDVHLGDESGVALVRRLVHDRVVPPTHVILMSGRAPGDLADLSAERIVAGFLPKSELSGAAVRALLGRAQPLPITAPEGR